LARCGRGARRGLVQGAGRSAAWALPALGAVGPGAASRGACSCVRESREMRGERDAWEREQRREKRIRGERKIREGGGGYWLLPGSARAAT
jgi:hypothetical protein